MAGRKHTAEQIISILRQVEVGIGNGKAAPQACREASVTVPTFYLSLAQGEWHGLKPDLARRLKELEKEDSRLKRGDCRTVAAEPNPEGRGGGKLLSPERRRCAVEHARVELRVSSKQRGRFWRPPASGELMLLQVLPVTL